MSATKTKPLIELCRAIVRQRFTQLSRPRMMQHRERGRDAEAMVVQQESVQQRGLVAEEEFRGEDVRRVIVRKQDVVEVNPRSRQKVRKCIADDLRDLASRPERVAGVDKEEPSALQHLRDGQLRDFEFFGDETNLSGSGLLDKERRRVWLDADDLRLVARICRGKNTNSRRDTASYLHDAPRLLRADKAIQKVRFDRAESLRKIVHLASALMNRCGGHRRREALRTSDDEALLGLRIGASNVLHAAWSSPCLRGTKLADKGNLGIKVSRQNIDFELLSNFKGLAHQSLDVVL